VRSAGEHLLGEDGGELALLVELLDDVEAADELAVDVELRVGGPVAQLLEPLPHLVVAQDVEGAEPDVLLVQNLHDLPAEAALGRLRRACINDTNITISISIIINVSITNINNVIIIMMNSLLALWDREGADPS
jgi:hypothetical protein